MYMLSPNAQPIKMTIAEAKAITGGLSNPSKMPGKAYNLSAYDCTNGSILAENDMSVCSGCYARKGRYNFKNVKAAMARRLASLSNPLWIDAMVTLINKQSPDYFRWHDSGDLQSIQHLLMIVRVAELTPNTKHWLPTKEYGIISQYKKTYAFPDNLCVRVSAPFVDMVPNLKSCFGSMVSTSETTEAYNCPAYKQGNQCGDCRACWDFSVPIVSYPKH